MEDRPSQHQEQTTQTEDYIVDPTFRSLAVATMNVGGLSLGYGAGHLITYRIREPYHQAQAEIQAIKDENSAIKLVSPDSVINGRERLAVNQQKIEGLEAEYPDNLKTVDEMGIYAGFIIAGLAVGITLGKFISGKGFQKLLRTSGGYSESKPAEATD